ncbi:MAG TPA: glycosyltransferase, partial [Terriglobales bacterium]|nr:glycosyltransferase [Terriglobales bacterium]
MNICLVTAFPPSREALNEYGYHIARELKDIPGLNLTILGDDLPSPQPELEGFSVVRCWAFNSLANPFRLLRAIRKCQPDVVWFNLGFASFGGRPLPAFAGIAIPALARMAGFHTHVTLHQLMETVDLKDAGIRFPLMYKVAGWLATQLLLFSNSLSVLLPAYRTLIRDKYRRGSVYVRRHGILSGRPEYPDFSQRANPTRRILAFGKWGTYKRLEPMIEAFQVVSSHVPDVELVVAGTDHPKALGYLDSVAKTCAHPQIKFLGYVPEENIGELFQSTSIAVMPYTSSAGSSGVAHLACAYGVPIVASNINDFRQLVEEENLAIELFQAGNTQSLAETLIDVLESPERQMDMAVQNFSAALRMSMPEIIRQYLRTFDLQHQLGLLSSVSRLRKLPRWLPLRNRLVRAAARKRLTQLSASAPPGTTESVYLLDRQRHGSGAVDGDGKASSWTGGG